MQVDWEKVVYQPLFGPTNYPGHIYKLMFIEVNLVHLKKKKRILLGKMTYLLQIGKSPSKSLWWSLRKLGVQEWLAKTMDLLECSKFFRVSGSFSDDFLVQLGLNLSYSHGALYRRITSVCPEELPYADDLVLQGLKFDASLQVLLALALAKTIIWICPDLCWIFIRLASSY